MKRIELFKKHLANRCAVKIISGIDNFDIERARKVVQAATMAQASAVDVAFDEDIIKMALNTTHLPVFVSSIVPEELAQAVDLGASAIEIGNFDALWKKGKTFNAAEVLEIARKTVKLIDTKDIFISATVPGHLKIEEQVDLAIALENMGVNLIQTEGACVSNVQNQNTQGLLEMANVTIANTIEIARNVSIPVMSASGLCPTTVPLAFASGASAVGVGSCINKLQSVIEMVATAKQIVQSAQKTQQVEFV